MGLPKEQRFFSTLATKTSSIVSFSRGQYRCSLVWKIMYAILESISVIYLGVICFERSMRLTRALATTSEPGVWTPAEMPEWAVPAAFGILTIVYALIVFRNGPPGLAAAIGGIVAVIALHVIGNGPDLGTVVTWIDEETIGLLIGMMVIVDILGKTGVFEWAAVQAYALKRRFHLEIIDYTLYNNSCFLSIFG